MSRLGTLIGGLFLVATGVVVVLVWKEAHPIGPDAVGPPTSKKLTNPGSDESMALFDSTREPVVSAGSGLQARDQRSHASALGHKPNAGHIALLQRRRKVDLADPGRLHSAREYATSPEFNPTGAVFQESALRELQSLIDAARARVGDLTNQRLDALSSVKDARIAAGQYVTLSPDEHTKIEDGTIPMFVRLAHDPGEKLIVLRYGEYAPLDVPTDEMWDIVEETQKEVQAFFLREAPK